jgi:hypothetical protein
MMVAMPASRQRIDRRSTALLVATVLFALMALALTLTAWGDFILADSLANLGCSVAGILYATLGALIVRRAQNLIGWLLQAVGLGLAVLSFAGAYAVFGIAAHPGSLPAPAAVGAIGESAFVVTASSLAFLLFFFPTGTLPSPRWRPILTIGIVATALTSIGFLVNPVSLALPAPGGALRVENPLGIESLRDQISTALVGTVWAMVLTVTAAFAALVARYRAGGRELRQQIKWVAFVAALAMIGNVVAFGALVACSCDSSPVATVMLAATVVLVFLGMPAALAIAILKYRLYEIDVIINRALVYGSLAAALTALYVGVVIGVGTLIGRRGSAFLTISAAVAIALLSSHSGGERSGSRTDSSTATERRPTRSCQTSPRRSGLHTGSTMCCSGRRRSSRREPERHGSTYGCGSAGSSAPPRPGRPGMQCPTVCSSASTVCFPLSTG